MGLFHWLKTQVRNAVLDGVNSALAELAAHPAPDGEPVRLSLEFKAAPAEPAAADEAPARSNGRRVKV